MKYICFIALFLALLFVSCKPNSLEQDYDGRIIEADGYVFFDDVVNSARYRVFWFVEKDNSANCFQSGTYFCRQVSVGCSNLRREHAGKAMKYRMINVGSAFGRRRFNYWILPVKIKLAVREENIAGSELDGANSGATFKSSAGDMIKLKGNFNYSYECISLQPRDGCFDTSLPSINVKSR
jgi:hypothetical protein